MPVKYTGAVRPRCPPSISSRSKKRVLAQWRERRRLRREPPAARGRARVGLLRRAAHRQRPPRASTTCGPGSFKDLYPRFQTMRGPLRRPQGRLGLPRPPGRDRGREGARHHEQARDRGVRHRRVQPAVPRVGAALRGGLVGAHHPHRHVARHRRRLLDARPTSTSRASGGCSSQIWDAGDIYEGHKVVPYCGRCGTALSSHELGQPGAYQDITDPSVYVRFPVVDRDFDLLVWTTTPWTLVSNVAARGRARRSTTCGCARARRTRPGARARRASPTCSATTSRSSARSPVDELVGLHYERPFDLPAARHHRRRARRRRRVRDHRRRVRHRAPRPRVRRDRPRGRRARRPPDAQPGRARRDLRRHAAPPGSSSKTPIPRSSRSWSAAGALVRVVDVPALVSALLAVQHAVDLLGQARVVRAHHRAQGRAAARERGHRLAPRAHQARPLRRLAREQRRLGAVARSVLGHAAARSGAATTAAPTRASARSPSSPSSRRRTSPTSTCTAPTSTTSSSTARSARVVAAGGSSPCSTCGSTPGPMPAAQFHYPFENQDLFERRFPADFICEAIDQTRGWFYSLLAVNTLVFAEVAVPQRRVPRAPARPGRPEDVEVARERDRPVDDPRDAGRRRAPLELPVVVVAVDAEAGLDRRHRRVDQALPRHALEHVVVLRDLRRPRRLGAGPASPAREPARPRPLDPLAPRRDRRRGDRIARSVRRAARAPRRSKASSTTSRTGTCAVPVRASGTPAANATTPRTRPCTSACTPSRSCSRRTARSCPTRSTRTSPRPTSRCTSPTGRPTTARRATSTSKTR